MVNMVEGMVPGDSIQIGKGPRHPRRERHEELVRSLGRLAEVGQGPPVETDES